MERNQLKNKLEAVKKLGISQKKISEEVGISQPTLSNALTGNKKVSIEKINELDKFLNTVLDTCKNQEDFNVKYFHNKKKVSKDINKLFKVGHYICSYCDEKGNVKTSIITIQKRANDLIMSFLFEDKEYSAASERNSFLLREVESYVEIHFEIEQIKSVHMFINFSDYPIDFSLGMMFYIKNHAPISSKIILEFINESSFECSIDKDILRFFNNKYLSRIKLPEYPILNKKELETKLWAKQKNKGWESIYFNETAVNLRKFDLFISTPINSLSYEQFEIMKMEVGKIARYFIDNKKYVVFCPTLNLNSLDEFNHRENLSRNYFANDNSSSNIFSVEVTNAIKNSNKFIFIDIESKIYQKVYQSAQIFQMGWALGQSTNNMVYYFVDNVDKVPILMRNQNLKNFKIVKMNSYTDILNYFMKFDSNAFSIDVLEDESFVLQ